MPAPSSCPGDQPTKLNVNFNGADIIVHGGGSGCYWSNSSGYADLWLDTTNERWVLEIAPIVAGGPSTGYREEPSVLGDYSNGAVVTEID